MNFGVPMSARCWTRSTRGGRRDIAFMLVTGGARSSSPTASFSPRRTRLALAEGKALRRRVATTASIPAGARRLDRTTRRIRAGAISQFA